MAYSDELIQAVWEKARVVPELDAEVWRRDECGAWIRRDHYGDVRSEFGWQIVNVSAGEGDAVEHLRALHRENGYDRANRAPKCRVKADLVDVPPSGHLREPRNRTL